MFKLIFLFKVFQQNNANVPTIDISKVLYTITYAIIVFLNIE